MPNGTEDDAWIEQLKSDLQEVEDISRSADASRRLRAETISAKAPDYFNSIADRARRATAKIGLGLEFEGERRESLFRVTSRIESRFARVDMALNLNARTIKVTYTKTAGPGDPVQTEEIIDIRLDTDDDLYLSQNGKRLLIGELLDRIFRATLSLHKPK